MPRRRGPKDWSPRPEPEDANAEIVALAQDLEKLHPEYRDWFFEYMYPGAFSYTRDGGDLTVFFTPDHEGRKGQVEIQLYNMLEGVDVGSAGPFAFRKDRTAENLFRIVKPILDAHSRTAPPMMGAVPEDVRLQRPWEATFPLMDALGNIFGKKAAPEIHEKVIRRVKEEPVQELGAGEKGVAYLLPSGRVLKLTADEDELRAAALIRGKDVPNVVRIHDAFYVREGDSGTGVIVRDAVDEALGWSGRYPNLASLLRFSVVLANDVFIQRSGAYDDERRALRDAMGFLADEIRDPKTHRLDAHERALVPGILAAMAALDKLGIYTIDLAPNNLGVTEGRPVVFDLSNASVPEDRVEAL